MPTFSAEQLAQILHPQELEILEEIALEFEDHEDGEDAASRPVLSHNLARLIVQASHNLQTYRGPSRRQPVEKNKSQSQTQESDNLSPLDRERFEELGQEIKDEEMGTRRLPAVPTRGEVHQILEAAQSQDRAINKRDHLIIRLMYATGCRRSELENMRLADMNFKGQQVFVRDGKWDKDRYVLIDKETAELMENFTYGLGLADPIFNIQDRQINRRIVHWAEVAGLTDRYEAQGRTFTSHSLRHAYATHMHESGFNIYTLKNLMGHRFFTTTKIYIHITVGNWLEQYERCHPLAQNSSRFT